MKNRTSRPLAFLTALVAAISVSPAHAQENRPGPTGVGATAISSPLLTPGQRLRVTAASPAFTGVTVGTLVKVGADTLTLVDPKSAAVTEVPLGSISRVEVSHQRRGTARGVLMGLGIGAGFALMVAADPEGCGDTYSSGSTTATVTRPCTTNEKVGIGAFFIAGMGLTGAWVGHRKTTDVWSDAPAPSRQSAGDLTWRVSPILTREGHGAGLRVGLTW